MGIIPKSDKSEYPGYAEMCMELLPDGGLVLKHLADNFRTAKEFVYAFPPEKLLYRPAPNEWTFEEILVRIFDDERIYAYRSLCFARNEKQSLPGFEQDEYALKS